MQTLRAWFACNVHDELNNDNDEHSADARLPALPRQRGTSGATCVQSSWNVGHDHKAVRPSRPPVQPRSSCRPDRCRRVTAIQKSGRQRLCLLSVPSSIFSLRSHEATKSTVLSYPPRHSAPRGIPCGRVFSAHRRQADLARNASRSPCGRHEWIVWQWEHLRVELGRHFVLV